MSANRRTAPKVKALVRPYALAWLVVGAVVRTAFGHEGRIEEVRHSTHETTRGRPSRLLIAGYGWVWLAEVSAVVERAPATLNVVPRTRR